MRRIIAVVALALGASWLCEPLCAFAQANLAKNGDLASGFDGAPSDWYALSSDKKLTKFSWTHTPDAGGVLGISNNSRTFSSWHQALMLRSGIYHVTAEARVEGAMRSEGGANIAISTYDGIQLISNHLQGTTDWQTLSFFLIEDRWGDTTELLCQLGVSGYPDTGRASFRNIKVIQVASPPPPGAVRFDLRAIRAVYKDQLHRPDENVAVRAIGVICGLAILGLLGSGIGETSRPALAARNAAWMIAAGLMLAITVVKFIALFHFTGLFLDILAETNRALLAVPLG